MKQCRTCGVEKPTELFSKKPDSKDGLQGVCKPCAAAYRKEWAVKKQSHLKAYHVQYQVDNKDRLAEQKRSRYQARQAENVANARQYRKDNHAATLRRAKDYRDRNAEAVKVGVKRWRSENGREWEKSRRHIAAEKASRRRAVHRNASPPWADKEAIRAIYAIARRLTQETGVLHHVDHTVPLIAKTVCGLHAHTNLAVLPATDNLVKSNRHWPDQP